MICGLNYCYLTLAGIWMDLVSWNKAGSKQIQGKKEFAFNLEGMILVKFQLVNR